MNTIIKIIIGLAFVIGIGFGVSIYETSDSQPVSTSYNPDAHPSGTQYMQWYPKPRKLSDFTLTNHKQMSMTHFLHAELVSLRALCFRICHLG